MSAVKELKAQEQAPSKGVQLKGVISTMVRAFTDIVPSVFDG